VRDAATLGPEKCGEVEAPQVLVRVFASTIQGGSQAQEVRAGLFFPGKSYAESHRGRIIADIRTVWQSVDRY
jgi:hypothetical protein